MMPERTPMRWPSGWTSAQFELLKHTAVNFLVTDNAEVAAEAKKRGWAAGGPGEAPPGTTIVKGAWPGVRMSRGGGAAAGPTGTAWVDSNGWRVMLETALHPGVQIWTDAPPPATLRMHPDAYVVAFADSAAYGGRWIITLDDRTASKIVEKDAVSLAVWERLAKTTLLFSEYKAWSAYKPIATVAVVSDFAGQNQAGNQELVNLLGRSGQQYRVILKSADFSLDGLRAVIYNDAAAPAPEVRDRILKFVRAGGLLVTNPAWGDDGESGADEHPRYTTRRLGAGRIAVAKAKSSDPYLLANDTAVLVSHRFDLVRFWNAGSAGSYLTVSEDGKKAIAHLLFYANEGPDSASVRVAGHYRQARVVMADKRELEAVPFKLQRGAIEVHLPPVPQYLALELEVSV